MVVRSPQKILCLAETLRTLAELVCLLLELI